MTKRRVRYKWFNEEWKAHEWASENSNAGYVEYCILLNEIDVNNLLSGKTLAIGGKEYGATIEVEL